MAELTNKEVKEAEKTGTVDMNSTSEAGSLNYIHTFKKPVEIEGEMYESIAFNYEDLTGEDVEAIEEELQQQSKYVISPEISKIFQCILAAKAAKVGSDEIRRLPVGDYLKIVNSARDFLVSVGY